MTRNDAIRKIRACLARAQDSTFPAEAARAMAQAKALMQRFDVEQPELLAAGAAEEWARSRATTTPPSYEVMLANAVADQFECRIVFNSRYFGNNRCGGYSFIGTGASAEIASYTFEVLSNQLKKARGEYTATHLKRYRKNKVAAADEFCRGWVYAIRNSAMTSSPNQDKSTAITAYIEHRFGTMESLPTTRRELANEGRSAQHSGNGYAEGSKAKVHAGLHKPHRPACLQKNSLKP